MTSSLLPVAASLMLVIGLILGLAWLLRRMPGGPRASGGLVRVKAALAVGTRERVVWIEAGGKQLLVGVTQQNIRTLHEFAGEGPADPPPGEGLPVGGAFAEQLRKLLGKQPQ